MKVALLHACTLLLCLPVAAIEKEVPPKIREGSTTQKPSTESPRSTESPKPAMKDGEREGRKPSAERDGQRKPNAERDGEKKPGMRDGESPTPSMTNRIVAVVNGHVITSNDVKKAIRASGGNKTEKEALDGLIQEQVAKTQNQPNQKPSIKLFDQEASPRDGDGEKKPGMRDGEGRKPSAESGQKPRKGDGDRETTSSGETLTLKVIDGGDTVLIGDEKIPMNRLRGFLNTFLPEHPGARVVVQAEANTEYKILIGVLDAVRDNGNKNASIKEE